MDLSDDVVMMSFDGIVTMEDGTEKMVEMDVTLVPCVHIGMTQAPAAATIADGYSRRR